MTQDKRKKETKRPAGAGESTQVVRDLLKTVEQKLGSDTVKATLGDYIRLVQLSKELEEEEPRDIRVTWVEPEEDGQAEPPAPRSKK